MFRNLGLGNTDTKKILVHFATYAVGYGLLAGVQYLTKVDFGQYNTVVAILSGTIADAIRKFFDGYKE